MSADTKIQWTWVPGYRGATWNPTRGCSIVSPGCHNCYAMKQAHRFDRPSGAYEGLTKMTAQGAQWSGKVALVEDALTIPLKKRIPTAYFVDSMSDLFHERVPFEFIDRVFAVMALCPHHLFMVLTKRPERMREYLRAHAAGGRHIWEAAQSIKMPRGEDKPETSWPLRNIWLGVSVEDQRRANERIPVLLDTPAAVRFISAEPLLSAIDLHGWIGCAVCGMPEPCKRPDHGDPQRGLDQVIVGGESGPRARPFDIGWARVLRDQCAAAGVAYFLKQLGRRPIGIDNSPEGCDACEMGLGAPRRAHGLGCLGRPLNDSHGGVEGEWPEDLRGCRAFPAVPR